MYRALLEALDRLPSLHFAHLGTGELSSAVDDLLQDAPAAVRGRIHRLPALEDTVAFYQALDGFVLASRYEGLALSALEAASTGLPMILSRCPGNEEFLNTGMNRIGWVAPGDFAALESEIIRWAEQNGEEGVCNHREISLAQFSAEKCHARLLACYQSGCWKPGQP